MAFLVYFLVRTIFLARGATPYGKGFAIAIVALGPEVLRLKAKLTGNQTLHTRIGAPEYGVQRLALYTIFTR